MKNRLPQRQTRYTPDWLIRLRQREFLEASMADYSHLIELIQSLSIRPIVSDEKPRTLQ